MIDTSRLKKRINESGYKLSFIAGQIGISRYSLSNKINNVTEFTQSEIAGLSKILHISADEICDIFFCE